MSGLAQIWSQHVPNLIDAIPTACFDVYKFGKHQRTIILSGHKSSWVIGALFRINSNPSHRSRPSGCGHHHQQPAHLSEARDPAAWRVPFTRFT